MATHRTEREAMLMEIEGIFDADGIRSLASALGRQLIEASQEDDTTALNAAVMAVALWTADPEIDKQNAIDLAHQFGKLVADFIEEDWDKLIATRNQFFPS